MKVAGTAAMVLATPNLASGQPKQTRPYELNNSSIDPSESGLVKIFDSVYIFSSDLEFVLKDGQTSKTQILPVGIVIKGKDGLLLLTAEHAVDSHEKYASPDGQRRIEVASVQGTYTLTTDDGKQVRLTKLAFDPEYDLALLRVPQGANVKSFPYKLGDSNDLTIGSFLYVIGNPENIGKNTLEGIVSSKVNPDDIRFKFNTTTPPGASGGPILAIRKGPSGKGQHELVGITVAGYTGVPIGEGVQVNRIKEKFGRYF